MKRSISLALVTGAALAIIGLVACQSEDEDPGYTTPAGTGGAAGNAGAANQGGNAGTTNNGGSAGNAGTTANGGNGQGGGGGSVVCMEGVATTLADIAKGVIGTDQAVKFEAIATTPPVLVYTNKSKGTCMWGVFVKDPAAAFATMVYSYGANATTDADGGLGDCPAASTSGLLDTVLPGDKLEIVGKTDAYVTSSCSADGGVAPPAQIQVEIKLTEKACGMKKTGTGDGAATKVAAADFAKIVAGAPEMQGMLVEINDVTAENQDGGSVGSYGIIKIAGGSGLEIHDKFYYKTLGAPKFCPDQHFNRITGIVHLDYCTWAIQPLDLVNSFDPPSPQCGN